MSDRAEDLETHARVGGEPAAGVAADGTGVDAPPRGVAGVPVSAGAPRPANDVGPPTSGDGAEPEPAKPSAGQRLKQAVGNALGLSSDGKLAEPPLTAEQINEFRRLALEEATSEDVSEELSIALGLAQRLRSRPCAVDSAYERLRFVFDCLLADPPKLILARDERLRLQVELYQQSGWLSRTLAGISAGSPVALVLTALAASLIVWTLVSLAYYQLGGLVQAPKFFFMDQTALGIVAFAALIGGVISIATRLREFSRVRDLDPFAMFWTALLKPLIGVVLAVFILAAFAGGIVSLGFLGEDPLRLAGSEAVEPKTWYILWVLGFLAGFSERFAWDFVDRAQGVANGGVAGTPKQAAAVQP